MLAITHRIGVAVVLVACLPGVACSRTDRGFDNSSGGSGGVTQTNSASNAAGSGGAQSSNASSKGGATSTNGTTTTDPALLTDGSSNTVSTGGLVYTFLDRSGKSTISPFTGKTDILDPLASEVEAPLSLGHGIESASGDNFAFHITGKVAKEPTWTATLGAAPT